MTKNENKIVKRAAGMVWDQVWVHFLHLSALSVHFYKIRILQLHEIPTLWLYRSSSRKKNL
jgi:hypothetical protein